MLNSLRDKVGAINDKNGFHEKEFNLGERLMLITSELAECLEADRVGRHSDLHSYAKRYDELMSSTNENLSEEGIEVRRKEVFKKLFKEYIKEGVEAELVDALIRILDTAYLMKIDLDSLFLLITDNNSLREYKHGKKY